MAWIAPRVKGGPDYLWDNRKVPIVDRATGQVVVGADGLPKYKFRTWGKSLKEEGILTDLDKARILENYEREKVLKQNGAWREEEEQRNNPKTWAHFIARYKSGIKKGRLTMVKEAIVIRHFEKICSPVLFSDITKEMAFSYVTARIADKTALSTLKTEIRYLSSIFSNAVEWGYVTKNPLFKFKVKHPDIVAEDEIHAWSEREVDCILEGMRKAYGEHWYFMGAVNYCQAMRLHELVKTQKEDFDLERRKHRIVGKGNKPARINIHRALLPLLQKNIEPGDTGPLFVWENGEPISARTYEKRFKGVIDDLLKKKSIHRYGSPHTMRHSCLTNMLDNGASLKEVQEHARHSNIATTSLYLHTARSNSPGIDKLNFGGNKAA